MLRHLFLVAVLVAASFVGASSPATVEIVLDASGAMNRPGVGKIPIHSSVREALVAVIAEAAATQPDLTIGLRLAGGDPRANDVESCLATRLALPAAETDHAQWLRTLDAVEPQGYRPLIASVLAAVGDPGIGSKSRRIVVVTSGGDDCGNTPQQVAAALAALDQPTELRMVGLGLDQSVLDRFGAVPTRNATSARELLDALRWAVLDIESETRPTGSLHLRQVGNDTNILETEIHFAELATGETHSEVLAGERGIDLPAGRYRLRVDPESGGRREYMGLLILADTATEIEIDLSPVKPSAIGIETDPALAGIHAWVDVAGTVAPGSRVLFADANGLAVSRLIDPGENDGWMALPPAVGPLDLLLVGPASDGVRPVLSRQTVTIISGKPNLEAPDEIGIGEELVVNWSGPQSNGDFIGLVPRDGSPTEVLSCTGGDSKSKGGLIAPLVESELDTIFIVGATMSVTARRPVKVVKPEVSLAAPERIAAGERFEIAWFGPEGDEDFLSLAHPGSTDEAYLDWARTDDGNPTVFHAPQTPGTYELRYVDGESGEAQARISIEIVTIPVALTVPATAIVGRRFEIVWTGPAAHGDFLAISRPDSRSDRYLDWASTTGGSPLTLAAPNRPGTYEVRYVSAAGRSILARFTIEVQR